MSLFQTADPKALQRAMLSSRARSMHLTRDLQGAQWWGPQLDIVNPPLWELGHLAWFQEHWCLRYREGRPPADSFFSGADALYDSARVAHETRWSLALPTVETTRAYQAEVLERVMQRLEREPDNRTLQYFVLLCVYHEDMHTEAFHYTRQTLGYADPFPADEAQAAPTGPTQGDVELDGGIFQLGASPDDGFVFDNEKWAHEVRVAPFRIARHAVTNREYLAFVDAGGYSRREWWDDEGWAWRAGQKAEAPRYWVRYDDSWTVRRFDSTRALAPEQPVIHVGWHEARAYCRFARRRLPTEAEWEYAAASQRASSSKRRFPWGDAAPAHLRANLEHGDVAAVDAYAAGDSACGCRQLLGNVWEWTESAFAAYPGFTIDPYREYSQPWFGTHKVLRGGSFATTFRLIRNTWRNFYTPDRSDVFAGFRTCAIDEIDSSVTNL